MNSKAAIQERREEDCKCGHRKRAHSTSMKFCRVPFCECKGFEVDTNVK